MGTWNVELNKLLGTRKTNVESAEPNVESAAAVLSSWCPKSLNHSTDPNATMSRLQAKSRVLF